MPPLVTTVSLEKSLNGTELMMFVKISAILPIMKILLVNVKHVQLNEQLESQQSSVLVVILGMYSKGHSVF